MMARPPNLLAATPRGWLHRVSLGAGLLALGIGVAAWAMHEHRALATLRAEVVAMEAETATLRRKLAARPPATAAQQTDIVARQAEKLVPTLAWLEQNWADDVAIARLDVDGAARTQRIELEAEHADALLMLVDRLSATPNVGTVSLTRQRQGDHAVEAELRLRWQDWQEPAR